MGNRTLTGHTAAVESAVFPDTTLVNDALPAIGTGAVPLPPGTSLHPVHGGHGVGAAGGRHGVTALSLGAPRCGRAS
ncbi:hypothetical protein [Nonomuraea sp. NPDC049725]|uniref:hypothetical protein n=1 Tax=Nonomuraea sp. NPDC049725 TaxID=3154508 RepID=UPI00341341F4